mgnify:CR=1 FL=1
MSQLGGGSAELCVPNRWGCDLLVILIKWEGGHLSAQIITMGGQKEGGQRTYLLTSMQTSCGGERSRANRRGSASNGGSCLCASSQKLIV